MKVCRGLEGLEGIFKNPAVTLGNFDGVHVGHQEIFSRLKKRAADIEGEALVLTFDPHPVKVLRPEMSPSLITSLDEKLRLLEESGLDGVVLADFTKEFAAQHPSQFAEELLCKALSAKLVIVGHDFTFGKGKQGTIGSLKEFGKKMGFDVEVVQPFKLNGEIVSSTGIRRLIMKGDVGNARELLGRYYTVEGEVIKGDSRGKSLGFPTANLAPHGELFPEDGVYAVKVLLGKRSMLGVANVGVKPTFGNSERNIEVHIFDFNKSIYGERLRLLFVAKVRDERRFGGPGELSAQIKRDILAAKDFLGREEP